MRAVALLLCALLALAAAPARGAEPAEDGPVDVALVLVSDVSRSIDDFEFGLQKQGYRAAFTDPRVIAAIRGGPAGAVAVAYVEFASFSDVRTVLDWTVIRDDASAHGFADRLVAAPRSFRGRTAIGSGIALAMQDLAASGFKGARQVIDVCGDGTANSGPNVEAERDRAVAAGVTINGLTIINDHPVGLRVRPCAAAGRADQVVSRPCHRRAGQLRAGGARVRRFRAGDDAQADRGDRGAVARTLTPARSRKRERVRRRKRSVHAWPLRRAAMASTFLWRGTGTDLGLAADWTEPALGGAAAPVAPGAADVATIDAATALDATGTLTVARLALAGTLGLTGGGAIAVGGAAVAAGTLSIAAAATVTAAGRIDAPVALGGALLAASGTLALFAPVAGGGTLGIGGHATLFAADPVAAGVVAAFTGQAGTLELFSAAPGFGGLIAGFASLDAIDIADAAITGAAWSARDAVAHRGRRGAARAAAGRAATAPIISSPSRTGWAGRRSRSPPRPSCPPPPAR